VRPAARIALLFALGAAAAAAIVDPAPAAGPRSWKAAVERVDAEMKMRWKAAGVEPAADASDAEFLRRVSLDLIGRIPTAGEAEAYLDDASPRRRERLVDRLLASSDYAEHWADVYLDLLVGRDLRLRPRLSRDGREFLRAGFAANTPYDELVGRILNASGPLDGNGAGAFLVTQQRKGGSIEAVAGETARLFLGLQVQCARCHDHPYDKRYTKQSFADFTAFFGDVRIRRDKAVMGPGGLTIMDSPLPARLVERPRARARFQRRLKKQPDLAYAFATPRYFFRAVDERAGESKRARLTRAILSSDLLAKAAVNRIWAQLFGRPIAGDAWDDLGAERDPSHPALLGILADELAASGYDHRRLLKVIVLSSAYGRSSAGAPADRAPAAERAFALAAVRPLSADQLYRSLLVAAGLAGTEQHRSADADGVRDERRRMMALREFLFTFPDDEERQGDAFTGSVSQALLLLNGNVANLGARARPQLALGRMQAASVDPGQRVEWMFLAALARRPSDDERARHVSYLERRGGAREAYEDLYHALLTSTEFTTNH
jgi:Protein of unknown function (DUF1549)/Protein of unknown function (DUF1553)